MTTNPKLDIIEADRSNSLDDLFQWAAKHLVELIKLIDSRKDRTRYLALFILGYGAAAFRSSLEIEKDFLPDNFTVRLAFAKGIGSTIQQVVKFFWFNDPWGDFSELAKTINQCLAELGERTTTFPTAPRDYLDPVQRIEGFYAGSKLRKKVDLLFKQVCQSSPPGSYDRLVTQFGIEFWESQRHFCVNQDQVGHHYLAGQSPQAVLVSSTLLFKDTGLATCSPWRASFFNLLTKQGNIEKNIVLQEDENLVYVDHPASPYIVIITFNNQIPQFSFKPKEGSAKSREVKSASVRIAEKNVAAMGIELDEGLYEIRREGFPKCRLSKNEWDLFVCLCLNHSRYMELLEIAREVWGSCGPEPGTQRNHICNLRKKLKSSVDLDIQYYQRKGYILIL